MYWICRINDVHWPVPPRHSTRRSTPPGSGPAAHQLRPPSQPIVRSIGRHRLQSTESSNPACIRIIFRLVSRRCTVASTTREWAVTALTHSASSGSRSPRWPRQLSVASSRASVASRSSLRGSLVLIGALSTLVGRPAAPAPQRSEPQLSSCCRSSTPSLPHTGDAIFLHPPDQLRHVAARFLLGALLERRVPSPAHEDPDLASSVARGARAERTTG
jgi:hypothetical protein